MKTSELLKNASINVAYARRYSSLACNGAARAADNNPACTSAWKKRMNKEHQMIYRALNDAARRLDIFQARYLAGEYGDVDVEM
jgi:hypothetical protein